MQKEDRRAGTEVRDHDRDREPDREAEPDSDSDGLAGRET